MRLQLTDGVLDLDAAHVERIESQELTPLEVRLLRHLARVAPRPVSNEDLLQAVWGYAPGARSRTVRVTVGRLRNKIEVDPSRPAHLVTVRGAGYRLDASPVRDLDLHPERIGGPLVGRREELAAVRQHLHAGRWVTLSGAPGIGKSRLALELAEDWPGPVAWFDCEPFLSGAAALGSIAARIGARLGDGASLGEQLAERVSLVVLDGLEALVVELAPVVEGWSRVAGLKVLATSRRPLGLASEVVLEIGPLDLDGCIELITTRSGLRPDEAVPYAEASDGVPLACELQAAAARGLLLEPVGTGLQAALDRSWSLLGPPLQRALVCCAVFEDAFSAAAAIGVLGPQAPGQLHQLRLHGLLTREGRRLRMLRSVREPLAQRLVETHDDAAERHARWFGTRAIEAGQQLFGSERRAAVDGLIGARAELEAVLTWAVAHDVELAARVLVPLVYALRLRTGEDLSHWEEAIVARDPADSPDVLRVRTAVLERSGTPAERAELEERARGLGLHEVAARSAMRAGRRAVLAGEAERAEQIFVDALKQPVPPRFRARVLLGLGKVARARGEPCRAHFLQAREALGSRIDPPVQGEIAMSLGREALDRGALREARQHFEEALRIGELDGDLLVLLPVGNLANAALVAGDLGTAIAGFERQERLARRLGDVRTQQIARIRAAFAKVQRGDEDADDSLAWAASSLGPEASAELQGALLQARVWRALDVGGDVDAVLAELDALDLPQARALEREQLHAVHAWTRGEAVPAELVERLLAAGQGSYARDLQALRALDGDPDGERALRQLGNEAGPMFTAFQAWVAARRRGAGQPPDVGAAQGFGVLIRLVCRR